MVFRLRRTGGAVEVDHGGVDFGTYPSVLVDGCDTTVPARGRISVHGVQATWTDEHGRLHLSGDKRAGPAPPGRPGDGPAGVSL